MNCKPSLTDVMLLVNMLLFISLELQSPFADETWTLTPKLSGSTLYLS